MSLNDNEGKQLQMTARQKLSNASSPIEKLRYKCMMRGASGINGLGRQFRIIDDDGNKALSKEEFRKGCADFGVSLSNEEVDELFTLIDADGSGSLVFNEFLEALREPMSDYRKNLVKRAFSQLDKSGDGFITPADLKGVYQARQHPKYQTGEWTEAQVFCEFLKTFECKGVTDGKVTWDEFLNYYSSVSASIDEDTYFDLMMRNAYKM